MPPDAPGPPRRGQPIGGARLAVKLPADAAAVGSAERPSLRTAARRPPSADAQGSSRTSTRRVWECVSGARAGPPLEDRMRPPSAKPEGAPRTSARSVLGRRAHGQALAALLTPPVQHGAAPPCAHASAEAVLPHSLAVTWLICWLPHCVSPNSGAKTTRLPAPWSTFTFPH